MRCLEALYDDYAVGAAAAAAAGLRIDGLGVDDETVDDRPLVAVTSSCVSSSAFVELSLFACASIEIIDWRCFSILFAALTSRTPLATLLAAPAKPPTTYPPAATPLARSTPPPVTMP